MYWRSRAESLRPRRARERVALHGGLVEVVITLEEGLFLEVLEVLTLLAVVFEVVKGSIWMEGCQRGKRL